MKDKSAGKHGNDMMIILAAVIVITAFLSAVKFLSQIVTEHYDDEKIVCIDAGHGGSDVGATSTDGKRLEKDDNLRLALKVRDELENRGVKVIMTRDDDSEITLKERCKLANKYRCDLFVSLHRNSSAKGTGIEAWISKNEKNGEKRLAKNLINAICEITGQENRGVKLGYRDGSANNYYINANTNMPSILLEVGFVTDKNDNKVFDEKTDEISKAVAKIIFESII